MKLPIPDQASQDHSDKVCQFIVDKIKQTGPISFKEYMRIALYEPGLGYYVAGSHKIGQGGDFVTAPEISPLFSECVARQCAAIISEIKHAQILELGAGTGRMALDILKKLTSLNCLPEKYLILEVSSELKARQQNLLQKELPEYFEKIIWLDKLPQQPFNGIILANEVIDAMPVHRICGKQEYFVNIEKDNFIWQLGNPSDEQLIERLTELQLPGNYSTEINLILASWIKSLAACLQQGIMFFIDYGYVDNEYFHPQRDMGTLMCHFQHHAHEDPLILSGIQDITASVNFTDLAVAAEEAQLEVMGFTHQTGFLLNLGITEITSNNDIAHFEATQQIKRLTLPSEMGERFKVMALGRNYSGELQGFQQFDLRDKL